jgi:hypothetical protein
MWVFCSRYNPASTRKDRGRSRRNSGRIAGIRESSRSARASPLHQSVGYSDVDWIELALCRAPCCRMLLISSPKLPRSVEGNKLDRRIGRMVTGAECRHLAKLRFLGRVWRTEELNRSSKWDFITSSRCPHLIAVCRFASLSWSPWKEVSPRV